MENILFEDLIENKLNEEEIASIVNKASEAAILFSNWFQRSDYVYQYFKRIYIPLDMNNSHTIKYEQHRKLLFEEFIKNHYANEKQNYERNYS